MYERTLWFVSGAITLCAFGEWSHDQGTFNNFMAWTQALLALPSHFFPAIVLCSYLGTIEVAHGVLFAGMLVLIKLGLGLFFDTLFRHET